MSDTDIAAMLPPDPPSEEKDPASESVANLQITSGCAYDVTHCLDRIVELFDENEELRYQYFLEVWKEMNFGLVSARVNF